ncbi:actin-related protein Arp6 [Coprinellus micaceus]|uniref:Actin-like protein ARP6 n=1 Tax=Coprinellus micaceus TaxID=71717 RepID=A0A4Y7U0X5_COPMI|nr:actin-related protein Arp6 [Coprinellus micaceus]
MKKPIVILENGGSTIKVGLANRGRGKDPRIIQNAVIRSKGDKVTYIGHEFEACQDFASLHYRLYLLKRWANNWDAQKAVWDGIFSDQVDTTESSVLVTEPYFNLHNLQEVYDQFMFEEYEFQSYYRCPPASLIPFGTLFSQPSLSPPDCVVVVDSGFSFTHVVPIMEGRILWTAVKRLDVGGKLLTNHLKELVSFRQWNMMDETYIMNHVKESCCLVSSNFKPRSRRLADPKGNPIVREYVLPDLTQNKQGRIRQPGDIVTDNDQVLVMNNERFTVPELLFRPDDLGLQQAGLPVVIRHCISLLPEELQGVFWANIGLIGGNAKFPGLKQRLPITEAYKSAFAFASRPDFTQHVVTRAEYAEYGSNASRRKFPDWKKAELEHESEKDATSQSEDDRPPASSSKLSRIRSKSNATAGSASLHRR